MLNIFIIISDKVVVFQLLSNCARNEREKRGSAVCSTIDFTIEKSIPEATFGLFYFHDPETPLLFIGMKQKMDIFSPLEGTCWYSLIQSDLCGSTSYTMR